MPSAKVAKGLAVCARNNYFATAHYHGRSKHSYQPTMGVNHRGTRGTSPPEFGVGWGSNANCPPRFCHVSKFQAARLLALQCSNAIKSLSAPLL